MVEAYRPSSLEEALKIRADKGALPFAGGTDLMVKYRYESGAVPEYPAPVIFLTHLEEIRKIYSQDGELHLGAGTSLAELMSHSEVPELLKEAVRTIAAPGLRNTATLAGNICNASPAADGVCALYALDSRVKLSSPRSSRELAIYEFITGPGKTELREDELLTEIIIPRDRSTTRLFRKVGTRKANALSKLSIAAAARLSGERVDEVRIALGAVAPTVLRSVELEKQIQGLSRAELSERLEHFVQSYEAMVQPIDDQRSTAVYRKKVAVNLLRQFLTSIAA
ncbi:MAG TPA: molybdopterin dehydrogenase [Sediminispirochaeta sp.]|nr:molybdopterin dehydrogenase [Sediminispirochaeta sp.]